MSKSSIVYNSTTPQFNYENHNIIRKYSMDKFSFFNNLDFANILCFYCPHVQIVWFLLLALNGYRREVDKRKFEGFSELYETFSSMHVDISVTLFLFCYILEVNGVKRRLCGIVTFMLFYNLFIIYVVSVNGSNTCMLL